MNRITELEKYLEYKLNYLRDKLNKTPTITCCKRRDGSVSYRCVLNDKTIEHRSTTTIGKQLEQAYIEQQKIKARIKELHGALQIVHQEIYSHTALNPYNRTNLTNCRRKYGEWKELIEVSNTNHNKAHHIHRDKDMDSKAETSISEVYELLNIPYKHGVGIDIDGYSFIIDFVPLIEETGDYFLHEHFGLNDKYSYAKKTVRKFEAFQNDDLIIGKDVLMTFETRENFADKNYYINSIIMILNNIFY